MREAGAPQPLNPLTNPLLAARLVPSAAASRPTVLAVLGGQGAAPIASDTAVAAAAGAAAAAASAPRDTASPDTLAALAEGEGDGDGGAADAPGSPQSDARSLGRALSRLAALAVAEARYPAPAELARLLGAPRALLTCALTC
jgi:hypothetical protein